MALPMLTSDDVNLIYETRKEISGNRQIEVTVYLQTVLSRDSYTGTPSEFSDFRNIYGVFKEYDQKNNFFLNRFGGELEQGSHVFIMDYIDDTGDDDWIDYTKINVIAVDGINYGVLSTREVGIKRINKIYFLLQRKD